MTLFLDSSVLLAACGSREGASREVFRLAPKQRWTLVTIPYVLEEVIRNLKNLPPNASADWVRLRRQLTIEDNVLSLDRPTTFGSAKDRPILFQRTRMGGCAAHPGFKGFRGTAWRRFYGLPVLRTGAFWEHERAMNRLR